MKGGHKISLSLAWQLAEHNIESVPGWKLCRKCFDRATPTLKETGPTMEVDLESFEDMDIGELDSSFTQEQHRDTLNDGLMTIGASPVKTHSMPKHRRISYAKKKIEKTLGSIKQSFACAIGVWVENLSSG